MMIPEAKTSNMVKRYFHDRSDEIEEMHDAFAIKPPHGADRLPSEQSRLFMEELRKFNSYIDRVSHEVNVDFDIKNCTWSDVLGKLVDANEAVAKRMERDKTLWSKGGAVLADMSNMIQPALQAIPDDLCFLHGGIALTLHLAKGRDKTKQDIVNAFEDVAFTFAIAGNAVEHFSGDPRLCDALDKLRMTLFDVIPSLISILVPDRLLGKLAAPFRTFQSDRLLETVRVDSKRVENRARALTDHHQNQAAKITKDHVEEIHDGVLGLHVLQQDILAMVNFALAGQDGMAKMLSDAVEMFNYHKHEQSLKPSVSQSKGSRRRSSSSASPDNGKVFTLHCLLDVKRGQEAQDLAHVRRQEQEFDAKSKFSVASIFINTNFQRWMASDTADLIYIEGRLDKLYGNTSPISYFCAQLVQKLKESPPTMATLYFFCGQHVRLNSPLRGPRGLMRSLLSQILRVWPMVSLDDNINLEGIDNEAALSMHNLCHLFRVIANQLPPNYTVRCIINDVNRLERDEWEEDYWVFMRMLEEMVDGGNNDDDDDGLQFKVLISSSGQSRWLRDENKVNEEHRVLVTDSGWACR